MAKQQAKRPMCLARDEKDNPHGEGLYVLSPLKLSKTKDGIWRDRNAREIIIASTQSPVELEPGGGPVRVRLVEVKE